jgi:hypothetical protein
VRYRGEAIAALARAHNQHAPASPGKLQGGRLSRMAATDYDDVEVGRGMFSIHGTCILSQSENCVGGHGNLLTGSMFVFKQKIRFWLKCRGLKMLQLYRSVCRVAAIKGHPQTR